jgi:diguanylate cyclase (GGDEF)-like protein
VGVAVPAQLFTAGLLLRIGELALASVHPLEYARLLESARDRKDLDILELEVERLGIDHCEVTGELLKDWGLPPDMCSAVAHARTGKPAEQLPATTRELIGLLRCAAVLANYCVEDEGLHHEHLEGLEGVRESLGLQEQPFRRLCSAGAAEWRTWGGLLRIPTCTPPAVEEVVDSDEARAPESSSAGGTAEVSGGEGGKDIEKVAARATRSPGGGLRILAVDDDSMSLKLLATYLRATGHEVTTARNGREALACALESNPQIVVTDWMMPEMDGIEFTRALRRFETGRTIYVLILTGQEQEDRVVEAFEAGVDDYVTKPFNPRVLLARVNAGQRVVRLQQQVEADKRTQREQVARLAVLTRKLRAAAMTDPLTELPNRRYAMRRLEEEWASGNRNGAPLSAVLIDIDHFKLVNDRHGHHVGDCVLREVSELIDATTREEDVTARIGGEEFLVICPNTAADGALQCAERVRAAVEQHLFQGSDFQLSVTVSVGVATRGEGCESIDDLLQFADAATYDAKGAGRNTVRVWASDSSRRRSA